MSQTVSTEFKTTKSNVSGHPLMACAAGTLVKPGELIDLKEITALNLTDWRIYNQLLANAWDAIDQNVVHRIHKSYLRGSHGSTDRITESLKRLMGAIATVAITKDGKPSQLHVQLLGANIVQDADGGYFYYKFPDEMRVIITRSTVFARIKSHVMYALRSKYALRLYEIVQKRANLKYKRFEEFTVEEFRNLLGVPKGKLKRFADLNKHAITPAIEELDKVGCHKVWTENLREGRSVKKIVLYWHEKRSEDQLAALDEVQRRNGLLQ
ncbi:MAG: replication initiation protein [Pseudomonadota bacterium]